MGMLFPVYLVMPPRIVLYLLGEFWNMPAVEVLLCLKPFLSEDEQQNLNQRRITN